MTHSIPPAPARISVVVADFIALVALTFAVGLAVSVAMAGIVVLLSSEAPAAMPVQARPAATAPKAAPARLDGGFGAPAPLPQGVRS